LFLSSLLLSLCVFGILEEIPDEARIAWAIHDLRIIYYLKGDLEKAENLTLRSIRIKRQKEDSQGIAVSLSQLGVIRMKQGENEEAKKLFSEAYQIAKKLPNKKLIKKITSYLKFLT